MHSSKLKYLILLFTVIFLSGLSWNVSAQQNDWYSGEYHIGQYKGDALFEYRLQDKDTILDGTFQMQRSNLSELLEQEDFSFSIKGNFEENTPEGAWNFSFGSFQTDKESKVVDYQYRVSVSGVQESASGLLRRGKPHGSWVYSVDSIAKSEISRSLFKSTIEFQEGVPQRSFRIETEDYALVGRCLRNGLAHDLWSVYNVDGVGAQESWYFENGILRRIDTQKQGETISEVIFDNLSADRKTIELDQGFFRILEIKRATHPGINKNGALYAVLKQNSAYYGKINNILSELATADFRPGFKVVTEYYPFTEIETSQLDSIEVLSREAKSISESLLNNTQLNIVRHSDPEAAYLYNVLTELSSRFVEPLDKISQLKADGVLEAVNREELKTYLWPDGLPSPIIEVSETDDSDENRTFTGPDAGLMNFSSNGVPAVLQMANYTVQSLNSVSQLLASKLNIDKREQELLQIEDRLIRQSNRIAKNVDSLQQITSSKTREAIISIGAVTGERLSSYSSLEDKDQKLEFGNQLLRCFDSMEKLVASVGSLPAQREEIKEVYFDAIWNPHMAVIMQEQIKKRITGAYNRFVVPEILDGIIANLNCDNAASYNSLLEELYRRMLEMREEDTSKLERKLKKEQDPQEILELFNVKPKTAD